MEASRNLLIPPKDILDPAIGKSWEHIILWMLAKNEQCEWSDFIDNISIPLSSLSTNLKKLQEDGYVFKPERNQYEILPEGLERLRELEYLRKHGKRALNYPPRAITRKRNYNDWILWMLFNNEYCKWSDFLSEPLRINSSSLSNSLNSLIKSNLFVKENGEYRITAEGKVAYFQMLKQYDLDRQSILDEESRRIEEITRNTNDFFERYQVDDDKVKFRFLNYVLKLNYSKVESLLNDEEDFNKILLFLSFNHPEFYPNYFSVEKFANKYGIKKTNLEFFLEKIVEEEFYTIKFHKLEVEPDREYYFQANGKLERVLRAIVDDKITRFTYLNKLREASSGEVPLIRINDIFEEIVSEVCLTHFQEGLKSALRMFLPEYIKYLAYKIESETKLTNTDAKLESIIIQAAMDDLKSYNVTPITTESGEIEYTYQLDSRLFEIMDGFYMDKFMLLKDKDFAERYNLTSLNFYQKLINTIKKQTNFSKLIELVDLNDKLLTELQRLILIDLYYTYKKDTNNAIKTSNSIIDKYPDEAVGYLFQSLTHFSSGNFNEALEVLKESEGLSYQIPLICQKAQVLAKMSKHEEARDLVDQALEKDPDNLFLIRTKIVTNMSKCCESDPDMIFEQVNKALETDPENLDMKMLKVIVYCMNKDYKEAKRFLDKQLGNYYYDEDYPSVGTSSLFMRALSYTARGKFEKALKDAKKAMVHYEDHYTALASKAVVLGYNLIFNLEPDHLDVEEFNDLIDKAITAAPNKAIKSRLLSFKACVYNEIGDVNESLNQVENAIILSPEDLGLYHQKVYILYSSKRKVEALDLIDYIVEQFEDGKFRMMQTKSVIYYQDKDFESALKVSDEMLKIFTKDKSKTNYASMLNNRTLFFAELGRKEDAIETAKEMIDVDKENGNLRDSFGEILLIMEDYDDAIEQFEEAIKLVKPTNNWYVDQSYIKMGLCYMKMGIYDKAKENFELGKALLEKKPPKERTAFEHDPNKYLMELKELVERNKNQ